MAPGGSEEDAENKPTTEVSYLDRCVLFYC